MRFKKNQENKKLQTLLRMGNFHQSQLTKAVLSPSRCKSSFLLEGDRAQSYGRAGKEDILNILTTRDSLGLGPLEIKLLRVTTSI